MTNIMPPRKYGKRSGKKRTKTSKTSKTRKPRGIPMEVASVSQTLQLGNDTTGVINQLEDINLSQFDRAVQVAQAYQYYRIKKVMMKFKPFYDTFQLRDITQPDGSVPYFYSRVDKGDVLNATSFNMLRDSGCKPRRFDEKTITVSWKPSILQYVQSSTNPTDPPSFNLSRTSPWLGTNLASGSTSTGWVASSLRHNGIIYGVEQGITGTPGFPYGVEITVHFEFKKPLVFKGVDDTSVAVIKEVKAK